MDSPHSPQQERPKLTSASQPPGWVSDAVFYQIFPDRFARSERVEKPSNLEPWDTPPTVHGYKGGDLLGVAERLDWLTDLGVNALYLNPIFRSASNHRYHTHDYYAIDPLLGGDQAFEEMLEACHDRGMKVILDGVFNHASRGFFQFHDILENGKDSPWVDWFHVESYPLQAYHPDEPPSYAAWWGLHALPKLNTDNPQVREHLMGVAEHWVERGIDGWRLDVPNEIDTEGFWEEFRERVRAVNPDAYLVGEIWEEAADWIAGGDRFDGTMNYLFGGATIAFAAGRRVRPNVVEGVPYRVRPALNAAGYRAAIEHLLELYPEESHRANLNLLGSHDTPRVSSVVGSDRASLILANLLLFTFPGAPCVYYGDEIGLAGGKDPANRAGFPWEHPESWDREILDAHRALIGLRRDHAVLRHGSYRTLEPQKTSGSSVYAFVREDDSETLLVALNTAADAQSAVYPEGTITGNGFKALWGSGEITGQDGLRITMPPRTGVVWRVE